MVVMFKRKILQVGDSLGITIPDDIVKTYKIKKGEKRFVVSGVVDGFLLVELAGKSRDEIWRELNI